MKRRSFRSALLLALAALALAAAGSSHARFNGEPESDEPRFLSAVCFTPPLRFEIEFLASTEAERVKDMPLFMAALSRELAANAKDTRILAYWDHKSGELRAKYSRGGRWWVIPFNLSNTYWVRGDLEPRTVVLVADTFMGEKKTGGHDNVVGLTVDAREVRRNVERAFQEALTRMLREPRPGDARHPDSFAGRARLVTHADAPALEGFIREGR